MSGFLFQTEVNDIPGYHSTPDTSKASNVNYGLQTPGSVFSPSNTLLQSELSDCTADEKLTPLDHLNSLLTSRSVSPVRCVLRSPWDESSERTKREHTRKARQAISVILDEIAPNDANRLWQAVTAKAGNKCNDACVDDSMMKALADCYINANTWDTRRQILSYMADKATFLEISQFIPGLTRYRFSSARQHILEHGRGAPIQPSTQPRKIVPQDKLSHFLDFITSPHIIQDLPFGGKTITLSNNEVLQVPNVVRNMIPERIVKQYKAYCAEVNVMPLSRSTLIRILQVCSASTRKSLQGLDYISASGSEAFDIVEGVVDRLEENMDLDISWAKRQKELLKLAKRYLKSDYKVCIENF